MIDVTPFMRMYARRRLGILAAQNPAATQERELLHLLKRAEKTRFGRDHSFSRLRSVHDFQKAVPLRRYEDFWQDYISPRFPVIDDELWPGKTPYFALSSGTTKGVTKHLPVTPDMARSNRQGGLDLLAHHLNARPKSRVLGGLSFLFGGSTDVVELAPGVHEGDLSGIAVRELPWWIKPWTFPPPELALIADWEEKIERLIPLALGRDVRMISGVPSWLLLAFDRLAALLGKKRFRLVDAWPHMEMVVHGGVSFEPYEGRFRELFEGSRAETREVYPASEGFVAVADRGHGQGLRMLLDHGIFFEFVPVEEIDADEPRRFWIADAEPSVNYAIVLSTCAGLWSYVLGDTVRLVERNPPRLVVTGRTSYMLSAFGEHLIGEEIEEAVARAAAAMDARLDDFCVAAQYPSRDGEPGRHHYVVEFAGTAPDEEGLARFAALVDERLIKANADYAAHRAKDLQLAGPRVSAAPVGFFAAWMKSRGRLGGQNKVPRVMRDQALFDGLLEFLADFPR